MSYLADRTKAMKKAIEDMEGFDFVYRHGVMASTGSEGACLVGFFDADSEYVAKRRIRQLNSTFNSYAGTSADVECVKEGSEDVYYVTYAVDWPFEAAAGYTGKRTPLF